MSVYDIVKALCGDENFASRASRRVESERKAGVNPTIRPLRKRKVRKMRKKQAISPEESAVNGSGGKIAYLLELLDGTLVNTTALVDQVTGSGGLAGVDVADNDDVDVRLFLTASDCQTMSPA